MMWFSPDGSPNILDFGSVKVLRKFKGKWL